MTNSPASVLIAIPTYRRPESLRLLLDRLTVPSRAEHVSILVLDNDPNGSAARVADHESLHGGGEIVGVSGGIASLRNAALETALSMGCSFLAYLDDDMRPLPDWLPSMLEVQRRFGADLVVGAIAQPESIADLPHVAAALKRLEGRGEGLLEQDITSGNLLVSMDFVRRSSIRFNTSLDSSGAEDTWFGREARQSGAVVAYAAGARAVEMNEASAVTPWRLARRSIANGRSLAALDELAQECQPRAILVARTVAAAGMLVAGGLAEVLRGDPAAAWRHLFTFCRNLGRLVGASRRSDAPYVGLGVREDDTPEDGVTKSLSP